MKLYLMLIKNKFSSNFAYRVDLYLRIIFQIIVLFIQIPLWRAVLGENTVEYKEMITYVVISTLISSITATGVIEKINQKIRTGELAMDLIKPMNFTSYIFCDNIGDNLFKLVFEVVPVMCVGVVLFGVSVPQNNTSLLFIISTLLAFLLNFLISLTLGFVAFWYLSVWHLARLLEDLIKLFGGSVIPLWYFPDVLYNIANFLPFKYIFYVPISIYLGKYSVNESVNLVVEQIIWCIVISLISCLVWKKGKNKIVIQGG